MGDNYVSGKALLLRGSLTVMTSQSPGRGADTLVLANDPSEGPMSNTSKGLGTGRPRMT